MGLNGIIKPLQTKYRHFITYNHLAYLILKIDKFIL